MSHFDERPNNNVVRRVIHASDITSAVIVSAGLDNPTKKIVVDDMKATVRISTNDELIIARGRREECIRRSCQMQELEINLCSFTGQIQTGTSHFRFFATHKR